MSAIMKSFCVSFIILSSFATLFTVTEAWMFKVGGNGVWSLNPQENYKTWAERNRFQVNDTLYFKYEKGSDSVKRVMEVDFNGCNVGNPLDNFVNGESMVTLNRSGPFYFISGNKDHCMKGQKLIVVVLALRNHTLVPISPAKPPSTTNPPKSSSPVSHSPSSPPAKSPGTPSPSPKSPSPVSHSPSHAPTKSPASPSPVSHSPSHAPTQPPVLPSPSPKSPSPPSLSPAKSPTSSPAEQTPTTSPSGSETTPSSDKITAPAASPKSSASGVAVTSVMTTVLSAAFTVLMLA